MARTKKTNQPVSKPAAKIAPRSTRNNNPLGQGKKYVAQ